MGKLPLSTPQAGTSGRWMYAIKDANALASSKEPYIKPSVFYESAVETTYVWAEPETIARHVIPSSAAPAPVAEFAYEIEHNRPVRTKADLKSEAEHVNCFRSLPILDVAIDYGLGHSGIIGPRKDVTYLPGLVAINFDDLEAGLEAHGKSARFVEDPEILGYRAYLLFDQNGAGVDIPFEVCKVVPLTLIKTELNRKIDSLDLRDGYTQTWSEERDRITEAYHNYTRNKVAAAIGEYESGKKMPRFARVLPNEVKAVA